MRALFALFIRSMREDARARLPPILRTAMVIIVLLILWANQRDFARRSAPGRELLMMVMMLNAGFLVVAAVSIFPSAITEEKEDETLPLLRMTNLNPFSILLGKAAPRLLAAMLLLAVQIPFALLAITLGGVTMAQVLSAYAVLGAAAVFLCGLALLASVYCRTAIRAGFLTTIIGAIIYAALPGLGAYLYRPRIMTAASTLGEQFFAWVIGSNPAYAIGTLIKRSSYPVSSVVWFNVGGGLLFGLLAWLLFDRYCAHVGEGIERPRKAADGRPRKRWAGVSRAWRWALVWKDFHFLAGGRAGFLMRCALALVIFLGACAYVEWIDPPYRYRNPTSDPYGYYQNGIPRPPSYYYWMEVSGISGVIAMMLAGLEIVLMTSRIFGVERRRLTLSSLVSLPWSTWRIIWQKVLGCLSVLLPWFLLALAAALTVWNPLMEELWIAIGESHFSWRQDRFELGVVIYMFLQALLFLLTVAWFSLRIRRGSLPAAIAVLTVWNILFGIIVDSVAHRNEADIVFTGVFLSVPAVIYMCRAVARRLELAAAED